MLLYTILHNSLNVLVQTANKMGLQKKSSKSVLGFNQPLETGAPSLVGKAAGALK
jgi:hypothetical protein